MTVLTNIAPIHNPYELSRLVANAIGKSEPSDWRHHGVGMLQMYLAPDLRIHIWHPELSLPGMLESGAMHDHRFDLLSHVLVGNMIHTELTLTEKPQGPFEVFTVHNASTGKTDDPFRRDDRRFSMLRRQNWIRAGSYYTFPKWQFHLSTVEGLCVTLARKLRQEDDKLAHLLAPAGSKPVHAFNHPPLDVDRIYELCAQAVKALETVG